MNRRTESPQKRYDAFISYSHTSGTDVAAALQKGIERLAKPWYRLRAAHVFRDTTDLAATPNLWEAVKRHLLDSEYLILLASPRAAASRWVKRELTTWLTQGKLDEHDRLSRDLTTRLSTERLLIVLLEGRLVWDDDANDFDWERTNALPTLLAGALTTEPLWVDLSWAASAPASDLHARNRAFFQAVVRLSVPIRDLDVRSLVDEDYANHRRILAVAGLAVLCLLTLAIGLWFAVGYARAEQDKAEQRAAELRHQAVFGHAQTARDPTLATLLLHSVDSRMIAPERHAALARRLAAEQLPVAILRGSNDQIDHVVFASDSRTIYTASGGKVRRWIHDGDWRSGRSDVFLRAEEADGDISALMVHPASDLLLATTHVSNVLLIASTASGSQDATVTRSEPPSVPAESGCRAEVWTCGGKESANSGFAVSPGAQWLAYRDLACGLRIWPTGNPESARTLIPECGVCAFDFGDSSGFPGLALCADGSVYAVTLGSEPRAELLSGGVRQSLPLSEKGVQRALDTNSERVIARLVRDDEDLLWFWDQGRARTATIPEPDATLSLLPGGEHVLAVTKNGRVSLFDFESGWQTLLEHSTPIRLFDDYLFGTRVPEELDGVEQKGAIGAPDGTTVLRVGYGGGELVRIDQPSTMLRFAPGARFDDRPSENAFSPDGRWVALVDFNEVRVYATRPELPSATHAHPERAYSIDVSADGSALLVGTQGAKVFLWRSPRVGATPLGTAGSGVARALFTDADHAALAFADGRIEIWELRPPKLLATQHLPATSGGHAYVLHAGPGRCIGWVSGGEAWLLEAPTYMPRPVSARLKADQVVASSAGNALAFSRRAEDHFDVHVVTLRTGASSVVESADEPRYLAVGDDGERVLVSYRSGKLAFFGKRGDRWIRRPLELPKPPPPHEADVPEVLALEFSRDGRQFAIGTDEGLVVLGNSEHPEQIHQLESRRRYGFMHVLRFDPSDERLLTCPGLGLVCPIWSTQSYEQVDSVTVHGIVSDALWHPGGRLYVAAESGIVSESFGLPDDALAFARASTTAALTFLERKRYLLEDDATAWQRYVAEEVSFGRTPLGREYLAAESSR